MICPKLSVTLCITTAHPNSTLCQPLNYTCLHSRRMMGVELNVTTSSWRTSRTGPSQHTRQQIYPRVRKRFVDDVITVVKKDRGQPLLQHLNCQHPRIRFTMEEEKDGTLPFMDVRFTRDVQGKLMREVYQKPTRAHPNRYVQFDSHHPSTVKAGIVQGLAECAVRVSSSDGERDAELGHISSVMVCNGYPRRFVDKAISKQLRS